MNKSTIQGIFILQIFTLLAITSTAYLTFMNKARIRATQRVMVDTQTRLSTTFAFMDDVAAKKIEREEAKKPLEKGVEAPTFTLEDENKQEVKLDDYKGQKTLLVFSQESCPYCQKFYPVLNEFQKQKDDIQVVVMQVGSTPDQNKVYKKEQGIHAPVLAASYKQLQAYKVQGTPTSVLLDEEGKVLGAEILSDLNELVEFVDASCSTCSVDG